MAKAKKKSAAGKDGGTAKKAPGGDDAIKALRGKIDIRSTPGRGTTFWFDLPFDVAAAPSAVPLWSMFANHLLKRSFW